ncbi:hypothetical protein FHE66_11760 [Georgenia sp. 311]|uniref:P-loop ATPase, Sll1717 family n=1 Tax=Georgenia sp. 311 TaxID=2585134 RepID=UPI0011118BE6|nr:hypothetical protein [Georgenia sp. 311]TNC17189.1 hypothetical protein FHE66_11760 [Georgenia sp. 311]
MTGIIQSSDRKPLTAIGSFGAVDADADVLLDACFQDHDAYVSVRDMRSFLILGRKGSGKTAIYKRIVEGRSQDAFQIGYSFDDYPWSHHDLQAENGVPEERRYIHSWRYLILLGLAKILLNDDQSQPWSEESAEAMEALESFVIDSYGSRNPEFNQLFSPERELHFKGRFGFRVLDVEMERVRVRELPIHIQAVNAKMQEAVLAALNPDIRYYVCFDQLDLGFTVQDARYAQRLTGLIIAARDLFVRAKGRGKALNPVVLLRDDIYQDLQFEDKNKITENYATRVLWTDSRTGLTLRSLMESRFAEALADGDREVKWEDVFDESREMPSRQSKYRHISDRTFLRPRDIIKFCNEVLVAHGRNNPDGEKFDNEAVHAARDAYSDYLLNELDDEMAKHVPRYKEYLEVLKSVGAEKFTLEQFSASLGQRVGFKSEEALSALAELFEFSVVSYLKPGGRGGGSEYVWRYKDPRARFDSTVESFRVHPGLKEALDLTR